jgi:hypothetical protein
MDNEYESKIKRIFLIHKDEGDGSRRINHMFCPECKQLHKHIVLQAPEEYTLTLSYWDGCLPVDKPVDNVDNDELSMGVDFSKRNHRRPYLEEDLRGYELVEYEDFKRFEKTAYRYIDADIKCPNCGYQVNLSHPSPNQQIHFMYDESGTEFPLWANHYINGEKIKYVWTTCFVSCYNDKLQYRIVKQFLVFNVRTGQTYLFEARDDKGRKVSKRENRIVNVSYMTSNVPRQSVMTNESLYALAESLRQMKAKILGYMPPSIEDYNNLFNEVKLQIDKERGDGTTIFKSSSGMSIDDIVYYNRMPNMAPDAFRDWKNRFLGSKKTRKNICKIKCDNPNPLGAILKELKHEVPKSIKKYLMVQPEYLDEYLIASMFFKDVSNIKKVMFSKYLQLHMDDLTVAFLKMLIEKLGETNVANKFITNKERSYLFYNGLRDTAEMYNRVQRLYPGIEPDTRGNIKEMHDRYQNIINIHERRVMEERQQDIVAGTFVSRPSSYENKVLSYTEEEMKYECVKGEFTFRWCRDTDEMRNVGVIMNICVGSYARRANEKECNIFLVTRNDKYYTCIELSEDSKTLYQCKTPHNQKAKGILKESILEWIKENDIELNTYDIQEDIETQWIQAEAEGPNYLQAN